ncbi:hypothetical protein [Patulibacter sp. SYSU D01012]|uniref:hypothetical protein n=1 Tax=Patulibacter sp. SYSU D01012 TaxID=2817381 RepID=UPI001B30C41D|nr:hypothetical protein [Patulibacter sp. SYSU D01012]
MRTLHPATAPRLRRSTLALTAASALALLVPVSASAADSLGAGGVTIPGSALKIGVSGAPGKAGKVSARFSTARTSLFSGPDTTGLNDSSATVFALNTSSGLYSGQDVHSTDNTPFTQTSAPALTGSGTVGDPYVVVSQFKAGTTAEVTQTITHVSGTSRFTATWAVKNVSGSPAPMQVFEGGDPVVAGETRGSGTLSGASASRVLGTVAPDGTSIQLVEQGVPPWVHYYSGPASTFYAATGDSGYGSLPDVVDPALQDSGLATDWDVAFAAGATKTFSVVWNFSRPALAQPPRITGGLPAQSGTTNARTASPAFAPAAGDAANAVAFECALDSGAFADCTSPKTLSGLADGPHTFSVRAVNSAGDPGPQTDRTWTVDGTPPGAPTFTSAPSGTVASSGASLSFSGEAGASFRCSVEGGPYVACTSPLTITGLADGDHVVRITQVDAAGNVGTDVATASWKVDTTPPSTPILLGAPSGTVGTDHASITLVGEAGAAFRCSLDGEAFRECDSPLVLTGLEDGGHVLEVKQVDAAGNESTPVAKASWTVDTKAPATPVLTGAPTGTVAVDHATIALAGEPDSAFRCSVDGGAYHECDSPLVLTGLTDGEHVVKVTQVDAAGNETAVPAKATWTVDTSVPAAPAVTPPADSTKTTTEVAFETPAGSTAECSLDDGPFQVCSSPVAVTGLAVGRHTLRVRMINAAGTVGAPRTVTWDVQAPAAPAAPAAATPAAPATGGSAAPSPGTIAPAACVSRRSMTLHWRLPRGAKARGFVVTVGGERVRRLSGAARSATVSLAGRAAGPVRVRVETVGRGPKLGTTRTYRTCLRPSQGRPGQPSIVLTRGR